MYRIQWITNEFPQPSACMVLMGPQTGQGFQNTNILEPQEYSKNRLQANIYSQNLAINNQFIIAAPLTEHTHSTKSINETPVFTAFSIQNQELNIKELKDPQLFSTIPNCKQDPLSISSNENEHFNEARSQTHQLSLANIQQILCNPEPQYKERFLAEKDQEQIASFPAFKIYPVEEASLPIMIIPDKVQNNFYQGGPLEENQLMEPSDDLPDKVLLEDAMKLFDCNPSHTEAGKSNFTCLANSKDMSDVNQTSNTISCPTNGSLHNFNSLNVLDDGSSPANMGNEGPEIFSTMDYFCDASETLSWLPDWFLQYNTFDSNSELTIQDPTSKMDINKPDI